MQTQSPFKTPSALSGQTLAGVLRQVVHPLSWAEARRLIAERRVRVNGTPCLDDARRLKEGDLIEIGDESRAAAAAEQQVRIVYSDDHLVVVEKPAGLPTVRRNEERDWSEERKRRVPVLQEIVERMLMPARAKEHGKGRKASNVNRVRAVHRLDRDTSGLMLFALSVFAEQELIRRFSSHEIQRVYRAVVHGILPEPRTIETWIVRDRGDGIRGSVRGGNPPADSQRAITHVRQIEQVGQAYSLVECRLETGRTHQIRIHLAEIGHMLCGEKMYLRPTLDGPAVEDKSGAPRQALHSAELELLHPVTGNAMQFQSHWPREMTRWLERLKAAES